MIRGISAGIFVGMFVLVSTLDGPAYAYLDAGTGSMVIQVVLGGIVGALTLAKIYWHRLRTMFSREGTKPNASIEK